jgi:hypothetical protein
MANGRFGPQNTTKIVLLRQAYMPIFVMSTVFVIVYVRNVRSQLVVIRNR